ncbi:phage terminase small subunit P27 family [Ralstonia insidiosa]|uniref:Phage terminase small subunit P27 family n=1 Tax=Ralstonia insidiosa TaxID=190721 RepID=A0A848NZ99_9RALS|nr:phage terminase small subunit P27 family [Ralstonia insidiosa]NMV36788.1 phage terminase small subunit P27 family [Ralstonia insidiosa]
MAGNGNSGRKSLPAVVHMIQGNRSKKPLSEIVQAGVKWELVKDAPECPAVLDDAAREIWDELAPDLYMLGLINKLDQGELAVYCQAYADWKHARAKINAAKRDAGYVDITPSGYKQISVWMQIANRAEERMRAAGASFGLNPSARARVQLPQGGQGELFGGDEKEKANKYFGAG